MTVKTTFVFTALRIVLVIFFAGSAIANIIGLPALVDEFERIGLGQGFRYVTALIQMAGALLLLSRMTAPCGNLLLLGVSIGALFAQLFALHGDIVHVFVLIAMVALLAWFDVKRWIGDRHGERAAVPGFR